MDGLELDFKFCSNSMQVLNVLDSMTNKQSKLQTTLAQTSCSCAAAVTHSKSLGLNSTQISCVFVSDRQPCVKLRQADIVAKCVNKSAITIFTLHNLIVRVGPELPSHAKFQSSSLSQISEESQSSHSQSVTTIKPLQNPAESIYAPQDLLFHKTSSSNDESKEEEEKRSRVRQSFHYNASAVHFIDEPCHN